VLEQAAPSRREATVLAIGALCLATVLGVRWWWAQRSAGPLPAIQTPAPGVRLDVNRAPWWEWDVLPGVGETLARRIVDDRAAHGPFRAVEDLARVPGISAEAVSRWRPFLSIETAGSPTRE